MGQAVVMAAADDTGSHSPTEATQEATQAGGRLHRSLEEDGRQTGMEEVVTGHDCQSWARETVAGELWMLLLGDE